jgi:hypothetical protein
MDCNSEQKNIEYRTAEVGSKNHSSRPLHFDIRCCLLFLLCWFSDNGKNTLLLTGTGPSRTYGVSWNSPWTTPGGDYASIGSVSLTPWTPVAISAASAIQTMIDAGPALQNILIRKTNSDYTQVTVTASVDVEFDLTD